MEEDELVSETGDVRCLFATMLSTYETATEQRRREFTGRIEDQSDRRAPTEKTEAQGGGGPTTS